MTAHSLVIEPLDTHLNRSDFRCGIASLDNYIRKQARQDVKRRVSRVFVATDSEQPEIIVAYYTLSALAIELNDLPQQFARKLPRHPVPAALLGRLAVRDKSRGNGVGRMLLVDALKRTLAVSDEIAIYAMIVDAIDDNAKRFYGQFDFTPFSSESRRLFLPLKSI